MLALPIHRERFCRACPHYIKHVGRCEFSTRGLTLPIWRGEIPHPDQCPHRDGFPEVDATDCSKWPRWAMLISKRSKPVDVGVGDTVQRIAAKFGGERFKSFAKHLGIDCGCAKRQAEWNIRFPYR